MKHISRLAIICGFLAINLLGVSFAGEPLGKDALETLIKGNTIEGKKVKWDTTYKMYFDASGKFIRTDSLNNKDRGEWRIESDGSLCIIRGKEKCRIIKQRSDGGGYDLYNLLGKLLLTIDKVSPGNPYNLAPK